MRLLLDTHVVLWQLLGTRPIGPQARAQIGAATELALSVVSVAEVGIKAGLGRLAVPEDFEARVRGGGVAVLALKPEHGLALARLPQHHRDPFDRLLVAQAQAEGLTLVTADGQIAAYDVPVLDPTR